MSSAFSFLRKGAEKGAHLLTNLRGWRTRRKLVVFESDDWGAIRMPGRAAYDALLKAGIRVDGSPYDRLDGLESRADFDALMGVLDTHRDQQGRPPVFTFNTVMGNPDFAAIECEGFERFHHQHMWESYRQYHGESLEGSWRGAIAGGLIRPQFHGREHLNATLWMRDLSQGLRDTRVAFQHGFYGLRTKTSSRWQPHYKAAYWAESPEEMALVCGIASDGLAMFQSTFGFSSRSFVACNYVLPEQLEAHLAGESVRMIQTQRGYAQPCLEAGGSLRVRRRFTGQRNEHGQSYSVRNVLFEPYLDQRADWVQRAMREIGQAFLLSTPAIICSHRINYSGGMEVAHRDASLRQLQDLLSRIRCRWPDVEFVSSEDLAILLERMH